MKEENCYLRVVEQLLPTANNIGVALLDGGRLRVTRSDKLILQLCDTLNALLLECRQARIKRFLFGKKELHGGEIAAIVITACRGLFLSCKNKTLKVSV